jgi:tRNA(Ile)-lysidine synthase
MNHSLLLPTSYLLPKKNLLAFSAGIDSSALFFLLIENNIKFDIAIVDYGIRKQSKEEVAHAKKLSREHKLFCHTIVAPTFTSHFEKNARDFRYEFFDSLVTIEGYDNILTAHQLNDQLEWLLMRLSKGAGVSELLGLETISQRENYTLVRPLLSQSKEELLHYLETNNYPYFIDESNCDEKYERNKFRHQFSDALMSEYGDGIKRSFAYLHKDKEALENTFETIFTYKELRILKLQDMSAKVKATDITLKKLGYLLSAAQRREIENENALVIGGKWAIVLEDALLYIAPYLTTDMPKTFKEACRKAKIPAKVRAYYFQEAITP